MHQVIDNVPAYIISRYPSYQSFYQALYTGEIIRDQYGNFHLREEIQPQYYQYNTYPLYMAEPNSTNFVEFDFFNIEGIRGYYKEEPDGFLIELVSAEDIARGAGLSYQRTDNRSHSKSGVEYEQFRWDRVNSYLLDIFPYIQHLVDPRLLNYIPSKIDRDSYIPLEIAVQIINKCNSEQARKFQAIVAVKIANEIRELNRQKHNTMIQELQNKIEEQNKTIEYYKNFTNTDQLFRMTEISKHFNLSPYAAHLILAKYGYIYKCNNMWIIKSEYQNNNWMVLRNESSMAESFWTEDGRRFVIEKLCSLGLIPGGYNNDDIVQALLSDNSCKNL